MNLRTTPDAMPYLLHEKNVKMLTSLKVMSEAEIRSRYEITLDNYRKIVNIEAETMVDMARRQILPAVEKFSSKLAQDIAVKKSIAPVVSGIYETTLVTRLSDLVEDIDAAVEDLAAALATFHKIDDVTESANMVRDVLLPKMAALRAPVTRPSSARPRAAGRFPPTAICCLVWSDFASDPTGLRQALWFRTLANGVLSLLKSGMPCAHGARGISLFRS